MTDAPVSKQEGNILAATLQHHDLLMRSSLFSPIVFLRLLVTFDLACSSRAGCASGTSATAAGRHRGLHPRPLAPRFALLTLQVGSCISLGGGQTFGLVGPQWDQTSVRGGRSRSRCFGELASEEKRIHHWKCRKNVH